MLALLLTNPRTPLALACKTKESNKIKEAVCQDQSSLDGSFDNIRCNMGNLEDTLRVLVEHRKAEIEQSVGIPSHNPCPMTALHWFVGPLEAFCWLSSEDKINLIDTGLQELYTSAAMVQSTQQVQPVKFLISKLWGLGQLVTTTFWGRTMLDCCIFLLVCGLFVQNDQQQCFDIMKQLLDAGANIHNSSEAIATPLTSWAYVSVDKYIEELDSDAWTFSDIATKYTKNLRAWADFVKQRGQDLDEYAKMEKEHGLNNWKFCWGEDIEDI